jgi:Amt family ammonium transporter
MIGFIYPVIVAWTWGEGWLYARGFDDFAGSGIVHMTGGIAGLVGTLICGPRLGRFTDMRTKKKLKDQESGEAQTQNSSPSSGNQSSASYAEVCRKFKDGEIEIEHVHAFIRSYTLTLDEKGFAGASPNSVVLGTLILWVGWMFFNGGSSLTISGGGWKSAGKAMVNTILAPSAAGLFTFLTRKYITGQNKDHRLDFGALTNGLLAGCVSVTASCAAVEPWAAIVIGLIGSVIYSGACVLTEKFEIDDPLEAF